MGKKTLMSWSSGKDSAWALQKLIESDEYDVVGLFCTVNQEFDRVAMHGVRTELLKLQATSIGFPLTILEIPYPCSNIDYEKIMGKFVSDSENQGIEIFGFGDLYLEDIRNYRIEKLKNSSIEPAFPLWESDTTQLAQQLIDAGVQTVTTCIDLKKLPASFVGRIYNQEFIESLPKEIDLCGENGEFHSFVFNSPIFSFQIDIEIGDNVQRDEFLFADIKVANN